MDELLNKIKNILFYPKLLTLNEIQLTFLFDTQVNKLIDKLLINYNYCIYYNFYKIHQLNIHTIIPLLIKNNIHNLLIDGINKINNNIIIIPLIIYNSIINGHITCIYINKKLNHILFFDPYGINLVQYNTIKPIIKNFIISNNILQKPKFIKFNFPIQKYIKDDTNLWYFEMSCGVLISLFSYFYLLSSNESENENYELLDRLIYYCKMIKKKENIDKLKELLIFMYVAIVYD